LTWFKKNWLPAFDKYNETGLDETRFVVIKVGNRLVLSVTRWLVRSDVCDVDGVFVRDVIKLVVCGQRDVHP
jgi:hypothetical protein